MKKLLFILILFNLIALTIKAQSYSPLIEINKYWDVWQWCTSNPYCGNCGASRYFLNGDTLIHGKMYKKIYYYNFIPDSSVPLPYYCPLNLVDTIAYFSNKFIREDTAQKKVYYYDNNIFTTYSTCVIDSEVVLYDFSVQPGDTLKCITVSTGNCSYSSVVDSVRYELIYGANRKVFYSNPVGFEMFNTIIEGIGGSGFGGGLFQFIPQAEFGGSTLECVMKYNSNDSLIYGSECAAPFITNIQNHSAKNSELYFFPNPTFDVITFNKEIKEKIVLFNTLGNIVFISNAGIKEININNLPNGIYYMKIAEKEYKIIKL